MPLDILKKIGRFILPRSLEEKFGLTKPEKPMVFEVGKGLTEEEKEKALGYIKKVTPPKAPTLKTSSVVNVIRSQIYKMEERETEITEYKKVYPERYKNVITPFKTFTLGPGNKEKLVAKGIWTKQEAELFAIPEVWPAFGGMTTVGPKAAKITGIERIKMATKALLKKIQPTKIQSQVRNLIKARYSEIKTGLLDSELFIRDIEKNLTKAEREQIPFIREGTMKGAKNLQEWANKTGEYLDEGYDYLAKNFDNVGFVENYVTHIWDIPKNKVSQVTSYFSTKNPFVQKRIIPTLKDGIKLGLKPKTTDIAEILRVYDNYKFTTVANKRFVDGVKMLTDDAGNPLIQSATKASADYMSIDSWALMGNKVNPEIAKEIKVILDRPFSGEAVKAMEVVYAFTKKAALSVSFFHHWALSESAVSAGIKGKMFGMWNPYKIYRALRYKDYDIFKKIPLTKDALQHQLQLGAIPDVQRHRVHTALKQIEYKTRNLPIVKKLTTGIRSFNEIWDRALWDYYHNGLKLYTYESWTQKELQRAVKTGSKESIDSIKNKVAQLVNDTFGGQVWENLLVTPKGRQVAHWVLLSPDWTLSTLRQAASPFATGVRGRLGRAFWLRAAFYMWGGSNAINYIMTKKDTGEGKFMWDNDPGHKTYIYVGKYEDGQKKYLRFGKQYREPLEWFANPVKKFGGKLAPVTREAIAQLSGYTSTGWKTEWAGKGFFDPDALQARAESLIKMWIPYSVSTVTRSKNLLGIVMPISKGLTWYEARELMVDAIRRRDEEYLIEIWRAALENELDAKKIYNSAKYEFSLGQRKEWNEVEKIIRDIKKMGREEGMKYYNELKEKGEITPDVEKQIRSILLQELEVQKQKAKVGI